MNLLLSISLFLFSLVCFASTEINIVKDNDVATGNTIDQSQIVPNGKTVVAKRFGCIDVAINDGKDSVVVLQWGDTGSGWTTIRACSRNTEFLVNRTFVGDGSKRFRIIRMNKSAVTKTIVYWIEALILDR